MRRTRSGPTRTRKTTKTKRPAAAESARQHSLQRFTETFFATFGASGRWTETPTGPVWEVDLPPTLAEHFGKPRLRLVFHNAEVTEDTDLVAYGSRLFDRMMDYLARRGGVTVLYLPAHHQGADRLLHALRPTNSHVADLKLRERSRLLCAFNWHITYRADDKREELVTVLMDEDGRRLGLWGDGVTYPEEVNSLSPEQLLADGRPPASEEEDGAPRLPPMTRLVRLAQEARKHALYHADVRSVAHEAEILPRLHKVLARITGYYRQQMEEIRDDHDPDGSRRRHLAEDLERKIAEEVENHRLRVQVTLVSYALFYLPVVEANLRLEDGRQAVSLQVRLDRYTGTLERPGCHHCGEPLETVLLCRNGHAICEACAAVCATCHQVVCVGCGVHTCPVCGQANCDGCGRFCWACGEHACPEHVDVCPVCGDEVCHACQEVCQACGERQCRSHLVVDGVSGAYLCTRCAVRCPGCGGYSVEMETCSVSGQRFCRHCTVSCSRCGRTVGPGLHQEDETGQPVCQHCLVTCPSCDRRVIATVTCAVGGEEGCVHCTYACHTCGVRLCPDHAATCEGCGAALCPEHAQGVGRQGRILCGDCAAECPVCGARYAREEMATCALCLEPCGPCCLDDAGICATCREALQATEPVAVGEEPVAADPRMRHAIPNFRWTKAGNRRFTVYVGRSHLTELMGLPGTLVVAVGDQVRRLRRILLPRVDRREP